ncbi:MAG: hypothetical protein ACPLX8_00540, partial [Nanopusillaceae archaeon]
GFGKIQEIFIDAKVLDIAITFSSSIEAIILRDLEDIIKSKNIEVKEYFTEGYFEGLLTTLFSIPMICINKSSLYNSDKSEFIIRKK